MTCDVCGEGNDFHNALFHRLDDRIKALEGRKPPIDDSAFAAADVLHKLWTWAVGLPGYDKKDWQTLEARIIELAKKR